MRGRAPRLTARQTGQGRRLSRSGPALAAGFEQGDPHGDGHVERVDLPAHGNAHQHVAALGHQPPQALSLSPQHQRKRAIEIHRGLLARTDLTRAERAHAHASLGTDYRKAGFLDRASSAYQEALDIDPRNGGADDPQEGVHGIVAEVGQLASAHTLKVTGRGSEALEWPARLEIGDAAHDLNGPALRIKRLERDGDAGGGSEIRRTIALDRHRAAPDAPPTKISEEAVARLAAHEWPGNVRQLENTIQRAVVMGGGRVITAGDLELVPPSAGRPGLDVPGFVRAGVPLRQVLADVTQDVGELHGVPQRCGGGQHLPETLAAQLPAMVSGFLGEYGARTPFYAAAVLTFINVIYGLLVLPESLKPGNRRAFDFARANPLGAFRQLWHYPVVIALLSVYLFYMLGHLALPSIWAFFTIEKFGWSPRDIGNLIREIQADTKKECESEIKDALFKHFWPKIQRGITAGAPEWFKEQLLASAFEKGDESD